MSTCNAIHVAEFIAWANGRGWAVYPKPDGSVQLRHAPSREVVTLWRRKRWPHHFNMRPGPGAALVGRFYRERRAWLRGIEYRVPDVMADALRGGS